MLALLAFIVTISLIVTVHEWGHFQVAKWCGVHVLRFSIGFGRPLLRKTFGRDQTEFVLSAIPLGGYVKMLDERELKAEQAQDNAHNKVYSALELTRAFNRQSVLKRIAIVLAGPLANLLLAVLLYWVLLMQGVVEMKPVLGQVKAGSAAAQASFVPSERIQKVGNQKVASWTDVRWQLLEASFKQKSILIETITADNELHVHTLKLDGLRAEADADVLDTLGFEMYRPKVPAVVGQVLANGVAQKAGLLTNDTIVSIDGLPVNDWDDVVNTVKLSPAKPLKFKIMRHNALMNLEVQPAAVRENKKLIGKIGVAAKIDQAAIAPFLITRHYSAVDGLQKAVGKTWQTASFSLKMLWYMLTGKASWKGISGPVTIASYAGESAGIGINTFIGFLALVSISIGVLNLLPIPVLDGGHLMYYMAEIIKGSPVSEQTMLAGQKIGFALLGLLMALAIYNDINRIFVG